MTASGQAAGRDPAGTRVPRGPEPGERLYLVDAHNLVHRVFHAGAPILAPGDGQTPVHAVIGWTRQMRALRVSHGCRFLLPIFDGPGPSWRHRELPTYKAKRKPQAPELASQWAPIAEVTRALGLAPVAVEGFEADDLLASYVEAARAAALEVVIVSNDSDLMQLVGGPEHGPGSVRQLDPFTGRRVGPAQVEAKFGVGPERLVDLLALTGDSADGIPGVPGIGPKIAAELLADYGDLDGVLDNAALVRQRKRSERLLAHRDDARFSRRLVALRRDVALPLALAELPLWRPSRRALDGFFAQYGYASFEAALDGPRPP